MTSESVANVIDTYDIPVDNADISLRTDLQNVEGYTPIDQTSGFALSRDAFANEETLARTIYHENLHLQELRAGYSPANEAEFAEWEANAYADEHQWWMTHPLNVTP